MHLCHPLTGFQLSWLQKFKEFPSPQKHFFQDPVKSQQWQTVAKGSGERCKLPQWSPRWRTSCKSIFGIRAAQKSTWWQQLWLFSSAVTYLFETKTCYLHHSVANPRTFQDLSSRFPGLSRRRGNPERWAASYTQTQHQMQVHVTFSWLSTYQWLQKWRTVPQHLLRYLLTSCHSKVK